jgi:hypothetical protein
MFATLVLVLLLSGLGATVRPAAAAEAAATCTQYHTVQKGEYLTMIAKQYGVSWRWLADINNLANPSLIYPGQKLCVATDGSSTPPPATIPTFSIASVVADSKVTITPYNFPANDSFNVLMGEYGTKGINGIKVTTVTTNANRQLSATTYDIPAGLKGLNRIAIRLESPASGYFAYNWFYNSSTGSGTGGGSTPGGSTYTGIPTFSIAAVVRDTNVTIQTKNFPPNLTFDVLMGQMGTRGVNGIKVGTLASGNGGSLSATFNIPPELKGLKQIAIRTQNSGTGYFSYNWFYNTTAP